jgi:hypothetical protein
LSLPDMPFGTGGRRRVRRRRIQSLAVSADSENWLLINASPDLPQQVQESKVLLFRRRESGDRERDSGKCRR